MNYDELKFKFDFNRLSLVEFSSLVMGAQMAEMSPHYQIISAAQIMEAAKKTSVKDPNTIPADMYGIFIREFGEALAEWARDTGLAPRKDD